MNLLFAIAFFIIAAMEPHSWIDILLVLAGVHSLYEFFTER